MAALNIGTPCPVQWRCLVHFIRMYRTRSCHVKKVNISSNHAKAMLKSTAKGMGKWKNWTARSWKSNCSRLDIFPEFILGSLMVTSPLKQLKEGGYIQNYVHNLMLSCVLMWTLIRGSLKKNGTGGLLGSLGPSGRRVLHATKAMSAQSAARCLCQIWNSMSCAFVTWHVTCFCFDFSSF